MKYLVSPIVVSLILLMVVACGGNGDSTQPEVIPTSNETTGKPTEPVKDVTIVIGNITDRTGPSSSALQYIDMALEDAVKYYNDNNLIPGVKLKLKEYDTQYDTAKVIIAYNYLKKEGADVITSFLPIVPEILSSVANSDEMTFFTANANKEYLYPPGYVFGWSCLWEETAYTQLKWIAENHWDYETNGPAKIGGAGWDDGATPVLFKAAKEYAQANPDQFEWVDGFITDFNFSWSSQVEALKDCDYIFIPTIMHMFTGEYVKAGYSKATFLANESQTTFLGMMSQAGRWDEIDGALFVMNLPWWGQGAEEEVPLIDELINAYHPGQGEEIKLAGRSYITAAIYAQLCEIIKMASEDVGPENVDSNAIYNAAQSFQYDTPDRPNFLNFSMTKRNGYNYFVISEADAELETLVSLSDYIPVVNEP